PAAQPPGLALRARLPRRPASPARAGRRARSQGRGRRWCHRGESMSERVIVGLSGGVDSAVAALLLKDAGHDVQGLFMSNWEEDDDGYCTTAQDYHYARLEPSPEGGALYKARDDAKDQSYFLHAVSRAQLSRTLMPLGELEKSAVRERARRSGLPVFDKPDSTGICFIGERPFRAFLT